MPCVCVPFTRALDRTPSVGWASSELPGIWHVFLRRCSRSSQCQDKLFVTLALRTSLACRHGTSSPWQEEQVGGRERPVRACAHDVLSLDGSGLGLTGFAAHGTSVACGLSILTVGRIVPGPGICGVGVYGFEVSSIYK